MKSIYNFLTNNFDAEISVYDKPCSQLDSSDQNNLSSLEDIRIGDKLFTKLSKLDSRNKRVIYTPKGIKD